MPLQGNFDPNFQFQSSAPINLAALMALRQKNPSLFAGVNQQQLSGLIQAMQKWRQSQASGQINFGASGANPDNDPTAGYYGGPMGAPDAYGG